MRNSKELLNDMGELTSIEWNTKLAEEYCLSFEVFHRYVSNYEYVQISEDNIHHKMKPLKEIDPNMSEKTVMDNFSGESDECLSISTSMRDLGQIEFEAGDIIDNIIYCGFLFNDSFMASSLYKNSIFNNCVSVNTDFSNSKIIQSKFIDCDFSDSTFDGATFIKCIFFDCNFKNARMSNVSFYDCLIYNCDFYESDFDYSDLSTSLIHNCNICNAHMRNVTLTSCSFSYCDFSNTNLRDSSIFDCNLISVDFSKSLLDGMFMAGSLATNVEVDEMYSNLFGIDSDDEELIDFNDDDEEEYDED